jgi:CheY-like chemotaxis protein
VLLVEDIPINRTIAISLLTKAGLAVSIATNGQEAVDLLQREDFRLVLMDIQMPVMDGLAACRIIRADPRLRDLPVIAMTAHATSEDQHDSRDAGMNAHVTKPVIAAVLYAAIARWLPPSATGEPAPAAARPLPADWPVIAGIDLQRGLALHMHQPELFLRSAETFRRDFAGPPTAFASTWPTASATRRRAWPIQRALLPPHWAPGSLPSRHANWKHGCGMNRNRQASWKRLPPPCCR